MNEIITSTATILNPQVSGAVHDLLLTALQAVTLLAVSGLTYGIKLGINSMNSGWKQKVAGRLVAFAAQRIAPNDEKRAYVAAKLHEQFPRIEEEEIDHLLEQAVVNMKAGLGAE